MASSWSVVTPASGREWPGLGAGAVNMTYVPVRDSESQWSGTGAWGQPAGSLGTASYFSATALCTTPRVPVIIHDNTPIHIHFRLLHCPFR
jgi:hypothetical protein